MGIDKAFEHVFVNEKSTKEIFGEVKEICSVIDPAMDISVLDEAFNDVVKLFKGEYKGYKECNTRYHDLDHTLAVFMATARLIHGAKVTGRLKNVNNIQNGLIAALFHDVGFIQEQGEDEGTGATHSTGHEERSIEIMKSDLQGKKVSEQDLENIAHIIRRTILDLSPEDIPKLPEDIDTLSKILGTADLIAQMADRMYLEKLLYLYREFEEAGVRGFVSELDLLKKTETFFKELSKTRLEQELGNMVVLMQDHFRERWGIDRNLYQEYIEKNIDYLKTILESHENDYRRMLRRGGIVAVLEDDFL